MTYDIYIVETYFHCDLIIYDVIFICVVNKE